MKKILVGLLVLLLLIAGGIAVFLFFRKPAFYRAENILPPQTVVFLDFPDAAGSRQRLAQSAPAKLFADPSVRRLLKTPRDAFLKGLEGRREAMVFIQEAIKMLSTAEGEGFVAVTDVSISPRFDLGIVAGFDPGKNRKEADRLLEKLVERCRIESPSVEFQDRKHGSFKYRVWSPRKEVVIAFGRLGNFEIFSLGEDSLKQVFDLASDPKKESLAQSPLFVANRARLGGAPDAAGKRTDGADATIFINPKAVLGNLKPLIESQASAAGPWGPLSAMQSLVGSTTMKGPMVESRSWMNIPPAAQAELGYGDFKKCERLTLNAAGSQTLLYGAMSMDCTAFYDRIMAELAKPGAGAGAAPIQSALKLLEDGGIRLRDDLLTQIGPEVGYILEWDANSPVPSVSLITQTKNPQQLQAAFDKVLWFVLGQLPPGAPAPETWTGPGNSNAITLPGPPGAPINPTFAIAGEVALLSLHRDGADKLLQSLAGSRDRLSTQKDFQQLDARFPKDYYTYVYCDIGHLYERLHGVLGPLIAMRQMAKPSDGAPFKPSDLPNPQAVARNFAPGAWTASVDAEGAHQLSIAPFDLPVLVLSLLDAMMSDDAKT